MSEKRKQQVKGVEVYIGMSIGVLSIGSSIGFSKTLLYEI